MFKDIFRRRIPHTSEDACILRPSMNELLPIGSIVRLKEGEKRLMISGVIQQEAGNDKATYDYMGVLYPEGYIGEDFQYLFNHEDIEEIYFRGFEDEERVDFIKKLADAYADIK